MATRFQRQQVLPDIVVAPGDIFPNISFCTTSTLHLLTYIPVAKDTRFPLLQVTLFISVPSADNSTKFEVYTPSDSNATTVCFFCHGFTISQLLVTPWLILSLSNNCSSLAFKSWQQGHHKQRVNVGQVLRWAAVVYSMGESN